MLIIKQWSIKMLTKGLTMSIYPTVNSLGKLPPTWHFWYNHHVVVTRLEILKTNEGVEEKDLETSIQELEPHALFFMLFFTLVFYIAWALSKKEARGHEVKPWITNRLVEGLQHMYHRYML